MEERVWKRLEPGLCVNALPTSLGLTVAHSLNLVKYLSTTTMEIALQYVQMDTMETTHLDQFTIPCDRYHAVTQMYNNCAETHLGGGVMRTFVSLCPPSLEHTIQLSSAV